MSTQNTDQLLSASQIVAEARKNVPEITVAQTREELDQGQPTTPYAKPELTTKRDARIIIACASGGRSMLAVQTLKKMGYTDVVSMVGGFNEWSKQGFPIEDGTGEMK